MPACTQTLFAAETPQQSKYDAWAMKPTKCLFALFAVFIASLVVEAPAQSSAPQATASRGVDSVYPDAHALYLDLHQHPELSSHETQTAAKLAERLRGLGYEVTEHVGGTGIVALMKNGTGPTVMLRTELDALPVEEKTGLDYASKVRAKDDAGHDVPVMHACGHDLHMAAIVGTAAIMARSKDRWPDTLIIIGQPAEETIGGAKAMVADGLFVRFRSLRGRRNAPSGNLRWSLAKSASCQAFTTLTRIL